MQGVAQAEIEERMNRVKAELLERIHSEPFNSSDDSDVLQDRWAEVMKMLREDVPDLLHKELDWDAFADDMKVELAGDTLTGKKILPEGSHMAVRVAHEYGSER